MKECTKCGVEKPLDDFHSRIDSKDGRRNECKVCKREQNQKWKEDNPDKIKEGSRNYRQSHRTELIEKAGLYQRTPAGRESHRKSSKKGRAEHPEKGAEYQRGYINKYPERYKAHYLVHNAIRDGKLERSIFCEECGLPADTQGHHEDYNQPLNVDWLCRKCHTELHLILV